MQPLRQLSLFDSMSIIVGIIIGASIYESAPLVASSMGNTSGTLMVWLVGGLLALAGAMCYAELATTYPREGGDYVYLTRAYGRMSGCLFGWAQLAIVRPGDIALMAFVFARYANQLWSLGPDMGMTYWASLLVIVLTMINILGVKSGRRTQNVLTVAKIVGLLAIVAAAFFASGPAASATTPTGEATPTMTRGNTPATATADTTATAMATNTATSPAPSGKSNFDYKLALILVLFAYGGWNEMAYVAAEVKNPQRNIMRALVMGALFVTVIYLLVNGAFLYKLGYTAMSHSQAVAVDTVGGAMATIPAGRLIAVLICISTAGAANGMIFTSARISYALGTEHAMFRAIGRWQPRLGTPVTALLTQGVISLAVVLVAGSFIDTIIYSAPVVWLFFAGTALSLFVLRVKDRQCERPYKVMGYPVVPLIFLACCIFMLYNSIDYAWQVKPKALYLMTGVVLSGIPVYAGSRWIESRRPQPPTEAPTEGP